MAFGSALGKFIAEAVIYFAVPSLSGVLTDPWYRGSIEYAWSCFAVIGICALFKGIFRFIQDRIG